MAKKCGDCKQQPPQFLSAVFSDGVGSGFIKRGIVSVEILVVHVVLRYAKRFTESIILEWVIQVISSILFQECPWSR